MVRNLRIAKPYFAPRADEGEGGAFMVDNGQLVCCEDNANMLADMGVVVCYCRPWRCI